MYGGSTCRVFELFNLFSVNLQGFASKFVLIGCPVLGSRLGALGQRPSFRPQLSACGRGWRVEQPVLKTRVNVVKTKAANLLVSRRCASLSSKSGMFEPELSIG